ncbi:transposase family protein [Streptomyces sp. NPDC020742]|uniref:helix-turn-helix domain-containing protein n=1 Tax=Streptomyces sp. NPDC020742 TaxID=3154897 RepID=UPI0033C477F2
MRAEGTGRKPKLVFLDRLLVTLVHLRPQLPHVVLAELFEVDRSTVSAAIRQVRPLLAARGFAVPDRPSLRLKTLEDVFAHAEAEGVELRLDGGRDPGPPPAGRPIRAAGHPPPDEHRTRPRPRHRLLITEQSSRQANTPEPQIPPRL